MADLAEELYPEQPEHDPSYSQASTAVLTGELDAFAGYLRQGAEGAALLGSKQRKKEIQDAWQLAITTWPHESRLKTLGQDLMPAITSG